MPQAQLTFLLRRVKCVYTGSRMKWWGRWKGHSWACCDRSWRDYLSHRQPWGSYSIQTGAPTSFGGNRVGCTRPLSKLWDDRHSPTLREVQIQEWLQNMYEMQKQTQILVESLNCFVSLIKNLMGGGAAGETISTGPKFVCPTPSHQDHSEPHDPSCRRSKA